MFACAQAGQSPYTARKTLLWAQATSEEGVEVIGPRSDRKLRASTEQLLPGKAWALRSESSRKVRTEVGQTRSTTLSGMTQKEAWRPCFLLRSISDLVTEVTSLL